ncbi:unnamed protein product, partial [Bubo scandiacus]
MRRGRADHSGASGPGRAKPLPRPGLDPGRRQSGSPAGLLTATSAGDGSRDTAVTGSRRMVRSPSCQ